MNLRNRKFLIIEKFVYTQLVYLGKDCFSATLQAVCQHYTGRIPSLLSAQHFHLQLVGLTGQIVQFHGPWAY